MPELPSGTVTFLFTDVEGSTRLLHELGAEAYAEELAEHRRIVRRICGEHRGVEVDTQGDAFFFAFPEASGGLEAARAITEGLATGPIRLRIGIHTGRPLLTEEGYVGDDVHVAARVAASAHGGQVVLSAATAAKIAPSNTLLQALSDLGEHRLKDIAEAVSIFQIGEGSFPPLKTISNTNLPRPASSFVGREGELAEVVSRIEAGARLLTLTGPGGSGKTRLALEAAASLVPEFKAGVFWVGLASLRDPVLVTETIAQTLGAKDGLREHIGERELLLLLDNLEQVIEAAPELSQLVQACPKLSLLVTSRELLRVSGEVEYAVPPLAAPEAVFLFCERSRLDASEEIAELCARLDSLPLAVELAAARTKALSPSQILERLAQRLDLLKGGRDADPRQQTLRATIEWSYELLSSEEQQLFARLSVFAGGCTLEAAEGVCEADLDTLQSLVEKSLLRLSNERYWMLEMIREYAGERLDESGESGVLREGHALHFLSLVEQAEPHLGDIDRARWLEALEAERDNLRSAFDWAREVGAAEVELRLATSLREFWNARGPMVEGLRRLEEAAVGAGDLLPERRFEALRFAALSALEVGQNDTAERLANEARRLARELGDRSGEISALSKIAHATRALGRPDEARALMEKAIRLARDLGDKETLARALMNFGALEDNERNFARAIELTEQSIAEGGEVFDPHGKAIAFLNLAGSLLRLGEAERATQGPLQQALTLSVELGDTYLVAACLENVAAAAAKRDIGRAATLLGAAHRLLEEVGARVDTELSEQVRTAAGDAYERAHSEGLGLSQEDAVAYARVSLD